MSNNDIKKQYVSRQVIENKLLTALEDSTNVAILASEHDLQIIIGSLNSSLWMDKDDQKKARDMAESLSELKRSAFPKR